MTSTNLSDVFLTAESICNRWINLRQLYPIGSENERISF